ncbi:MAG: Smr/MutS family protein [Bacilli bacterium]|nr:Smr/MutS family protein [Bacilli bacterium]
MLITSKTPKLDLHGEISSMVEVLVTEFINDHYLQNHSIVRIVHGKSKQILKNEVHRVLKKNDKVVQFKLNTWNLGETLVEIVSRN